MAGPPPQTEARRNAGPDRRARFEAAFRARVAEVTGAEAAGRDMAQLSAAYRQIALVARRRFWGPVNLALGYEERSQKALKYFHNTFRRGGAGEARGAGRRQDAIGEAGGAAGEPQGQEGISPVPHPDAAMQEGDVRLETQNNAGRQSGGQPGGGEGSHAREMQEVVDIFDFSFG